jgi:2-polyprenyl-3-methyl-5-hydroxy-6-metoxy-1,4-benzoquinol methylase
MRWQRKSAIFRALDRLPAGAVLHHLLQRLFSGRLTRSDEALRAIARRGQDIAQHFERASGRSIKEAVVLEIGAGRDLAMAIALAAAGARVVTVDRDRIARLGLVRRALSVIRGAEVAARVQRLTDLPTLAGVDYRAPAEATAPGLPAGSVDLVVSFDVMEHIPLEVISSLYRGLTVLLKPGGFFLADINYTDHYARGDASIGDFNFLVLDEAGWRPHNTRLHFQNRLRHSQHVKLLEENGFEVLSADSERSAPDPALLARLAPDFRDLVPDDLFTRRATLLARTTLSSLFGLGAPDGSRPRPRR